MLAALDNSRLTEALLGAALAKPNAPPPLFDIVSTHTKWSERPDLQIAQSPPCAVRSSRSTKYGALPTILLLIFFREILPESTRLACGGDGPLDYRLTARLGRAQGRLTI